LPKNLTELEAFNEGLDESQKLAAIHKGKEDGGISNILQSRIKVKNPGMTPQEILNDLRKIHEDDQGLRMGSI
jgi:hypothetical protein